MAGCREQFAAVKFSFLLGKSAVKTIVMIKTAHGDVALSKATSGYQKWRNVNRTLILFRASLIVKK